MFLVFIGGKCKKLFFLFIFIHKKTTALIREQPFELQKVISKCSILNYNIF